MAKGANMSNSNSPVEQLWTKTLVVYNSLPLPIRVLMIVGGVFFVLGLFQWLFQLLEMAPFFILFGLYFIPAIVAHTRHHRQVLAITVLNVVAGWTGKSRSRVD